MTVGEDTAIAHDRGEIAMEAILVRDQRTTSHRVLEHGTSPNNPMGADGPSVGATDTKWYKSILDKSFLYEAAISPTIERNGRNERRLSRDSACPVPAFYDDRGIRSRRNPSSDVTATTWLRLGSLLVILLVVSVHGAPAMTLEDRRLSSTPKWVNPCGLAAEDFTGDLEVVQLTDSQLLHQVVVQAKTALMHAKLFRDDYLDTALIDAYEYMQKYAVGLEQIVWDQEDLQLEFRKQFKETEYKLRTVLCELQVALVERQLSSRPDVTRDIMKSDFRKVSSSETFRNLRDWLIFRDYMNGLEYVVQVFEHLRRGLQS
ncbi:uncharacterized protein LOC107992404 isoform X2 [Apis cerana]|uniref:uncharacterized protein LOC107992404 isoform X2 n=1 Tax=Apis cerana TaxID=7461 RepID=UPI002B22C9AC|nr:uncharacterized protein LOC107992404 isoform X2 [Apis cerana]